MIFLCLLNFARSKFEVVIFRGSFSLKIVNIANLTIQQLRRIRYRYIHFSHALYVHKLKGYVDPTKVFLILKLFTATKFRSRPDVQLPITQPVLRLLMNTLKQTSSSFS